MASNKSVAGRQRGLRNALSIFAITFVVSLLLIGPVQSSLEEVEILAGIGILAFIIGFAVAADVYAVAVTAADEAPFHAMARHRVPGSKEAIAMLRNRERLNSIAADVIGDVCGTISGAVGAAIVANLRMLWPSAPAVLVGMVTLGLIAAFTVGSKAWTKGFAIRNANKIVTWVSRGYYIIKKVLPIRRAVQRPST